MNKYTDTTPPQTTTVQPVSYSEKQFLHTTGAAAWLPLLQSFITSVVMMIATATVIYLFDGIDYIKPMIAIGALTFSIMWLAMTGRWITLTKIERITHIDINRDGHIGQAPASRSIRVQIDKVTPEGHIENTSQWDFKDFATEDQIYKFCDGVMNKKIGLTETDWSPLEKGKPFAVGKYRAFRDELKKRGLIVAASNKRNNLGYVKTRVGEAVFKRILETRGED